MATILTGQPTAASIRHTLSRGETREKKAQSFSVASLLPSFADLMFVACVAVIVAAGSVFVSADGDAARHLTVGENILSGGQAPREDVFSFTMLGQPFVPYEWLSEVASAASYRLLGLAGPVLLHSAVIAFTFSLVLSRLIRRTSNLLLAVVVGVLVAATAQIHWLARPHVFTFLGTAVFCLVLDDWRARRSSHTSLWVLPPAMALWANLHGGFLVGLLLLGTYVGADVSRWLFGARETAADAANCLRKLVPITLVTLLATCVNPVGPALLAHVVGWFGDTLLINITHEYQSPDFHDANIRTFAAMVLIAVASMAWSRRRPALHEGLLLVGFTYLALYSARNVPLFAIVVSPVLTRQLAALPLPLGRFGAFIQRIATWLARRNRAFERVDARSRFHIWPVAVFVGLAVVAFVQREAGAPLGIGFDRNRQPVAAVAYLREHPLQGNMFNQLGWGGYLIHELWPSQHVFIDGQTDFYGEALARDYLDVVEVKPDWRDVLDRYDVKWMIYPSDSALEQVLMASGEWNTVYRDSVAVILTRGNASSAAPAAWT